MVVNMREVEGSKVKDASGNGCDLALGSTVKIVDSPVGKAIRVAGNQSDWASFVCPVITNTTISFWVNRDQFDSSILDGEGKELNGIPYVMSPSYSGFGINYQRNMLEMPLIDQANNPQTNFKGPSPARCQWHHLAYVTSCDPDGAYGKVTARVYMDGNLVATTEQTNNRPMLDVSLKTTVVLFNNATNGLRPTSGTFADLRFYAEALDAVQIAEIIAETAPCGLVMHYPFDELSATVGQDGRFTSPEATGFGGSISLGKNLYLVDDGIDGKALRFFSTDVSGTAIHEIGALITGPSVPLKERTYMAWVRRSSRACEMDALVDNAHPKLLDGHSVAGGGGSCECADLAGNERTLNFAPAGCGSSGQSYTTAGFAEIDTWSHLAFVERYTGDDVNAQVSIYVNGEEVQYSFDKKTYALQELAANRPFWLGANGRDSNRYFCGDVDDFKIFNYALSPEEVRRAYRGLAKIDAGEDFTACVGTSVLHGTVASNAGDNYRKGYAGDMRWSVVSAPANGEGVTILQPESAETEITLPAAGSYVFRMTISDLGVTKSDDVTITCVEADAANSAPSVSVSASANAITQPDPVVLTATVTDDDRPVPSKTRVRWAKKSGPGGVWFKPANAAVSEASFGSAGTYVLTCVVSDGQDESAADMTIAVADRLDGSNLNTGLLRYWSLDGQVNPYFLDPIARNVNVTVPDYKTIRYLPGKVGNAVRAYAYSGAGAYIDTGATAGEVAVNDTSYGGSNPPPANDYLTLSAWIYIDPSDTNLGNGRICGASVLGQGHTFGLRYNEKWTATGTVNQGGFTLYQQGRAGSDATGGISFSMVDYPAPSPSPVGRWMHICAILARTVADNALWEMWYDGVRQNVKAQTGAARGRITGNNLMIAGMQYTETTGDNGSVNANWPIKSGDKSDYYSRTFPGLVDEVRIWSRKLMPEEIRYLAANPMLGGNRGPAVDAPTAGHGAVTKSPTSVETVAFADKLPAGGALSYEWLALGENAAHVSFADKTAASTTFTASKKGSYIVQLKVSDGERTVYSQPLVVDVAGAGCVILLK